MPQTARKNKHSNDNAKFNIEPTQRLDFLSAIAMDEEIHVREANAVRVAVVLMSHRNGQTGLILLKLKTIAREACCSVSAAQHAIGVLVRAGWFEVVHRYYSEGQQGANQYVPNFAKALVGNDQRASRQRPADVNEDDSTWSAMTRGAGRQRLGALVVKDQPEPSEIEPGEIEPVIPECSASGTSCASFRGSAYGAGRHASDRPTPYKQTRAEADRTFERVKRMPWRKDSDDPEYQPSAEADHAAVIHWHKLLKSGIAASRIERAAERFLDETPRHLYPCLAGFLSRYASDCTEPDSYLYIAPDDEQPAAVNDDQRPPERKANGIDWENDPPF
jgi:hypothetical protein